MDVALPSSVGVDSPAKINLFLGVGPLRADGYHELATVFQALDMVDHVTAVADPGTAVQLEIAPGSGRVPKGGTNLALKAARLLKRKYKVKQGARLILSKSIPVAGGMAGGSTDAAAALVACNALWGLGLALDELSELGAELGSDVPFGLHGGTALGASRGEVLTPVLTTGTFVWVVATSFTSLSTPEVYATFDRLNATRDVPAPAVPRALLAALRRGDHEAVGTHLHNDLQAAAISMRPELDLLLEAGIDYGALGAMVSGSGPTCVFLAKDPEHAMELAVALSGTGLCRSAKIATGPVPGARITRAQD
ncbi:MAG: 4-(cytidine 5'-diphospho)-2-C-methyl-D-erythritol kinase [Actinobacteria bacterium]|nr:4-(cytidine 5'-diphospho)-2-C-methyl-D-erythritol kinase [Actinomycetota bacterium]HPE11568.1 4-(cytidine 5'-diphospho)-2-C-methyl-D-erythritol kinase [Actinomycetota bacterium]HPQ83228.1 4-(cytidine 5'-diphospho)-2-C-methyl-D-erythritol kinase [Actinomycetota bacterium]